MIYQHLNTDNMTEIILFQLKTQLLLLKSLVLAVILDSALLFVSYETGHQEPAPEMTCQIDKTLHNLYKRYGLIYKHTVYT